MSWVPRVATLRNIKTGTLQVWRKQTNLQEVSHPLLSPSDERANVQSDALGWSENDFVSPDSCHKAYNKRNLKQSNMKKIFIISIITMLSSLFSCQAQNKGYKSLSADDYEKAIADTTVIRLDVRTAEEFANGHIRGAINIDVLKPDFEQKATATLPKSKTIAVNCRSGKRSKNAAAILTKNGYQVIELDSGFNGWQAAGKEIVKK